MGKYPVAEFNRYYSELKGKVRDLRKYRHSLEIVSLARKSFREGGFGKVSSSLRRYYGKNRWRILFNSVLTECDNWRYALEDVKKAIELAEEYENKSTS